MADVTEHHEVRVQEGDSLIIIDLQNDFLPGGNLPVPQGDQVIEPLNRAIFHFKEKDLPIFASRDWHPAGHISFEAQGGPWPPHCVQNSKGASLASELDLPCQAGIVSKGSSPDTDQYSAFDGTDLDFQLKNLRVTRLMVGGLAQDICVRQTVLDARRLGYEVYLLEDGTRPVNQESEDGEQSLAEMEEAGARLIETGQLIM